VSGIPTSELTITNYRLLCHRIAVALQLMPNIDQLNAYATDLQANILFPDENIFDAAQSTCCVLTFWEPVYFSTLGNGVSEWPWISRLSPCPELPEGQIKKSLLTIAVRDDIDAFLGDAEIMAARGFPIDASGAATGAVASLFMQYLRSVYAEDLAIILLLKSTKVSPKDHGVHKAAQDTGKIKQAKTPGKGNGPRQIEIFALVFLRNGACRQTALNDFALSILGRRRALQPLGPWLLQISRSYANLKFANPEPIIRDYFIHRFVGFRPGVEIRDIERALLANRDNNLPGVFFYMDRAFLRVDSPQSPRATGDHLICVYRDAACPITVHGDAGLWDLCLSRGAWDTRDEGSPVPGWEVMLTYYRWLVASGSLVQDLNILNDREDYVLVKDKPLPAVPIAQNALNEAAALRSDFRALQVRMESTVKTMPRPDALVTSIKTELIPQLREISRYESQVYYSTAIGPLKAENAALRSRVQALESGAQQMTETLAGVAQASSDLHHTVQSQQHHMRDLQQQIADQQAEISADRAARREEWEHHLRTLANHRMLHEASVKSTSDLIAQFEDMQRQLARISRNSDHGSTRDRPHARSRSRSRSRSPPSST